MSTILELRFDRRTRDYFSAMRIAISLVVDPAGSLYAGCWRCKYSSEPCSACISPSGALTVACALLCPIDALVVTFW
ncbi:MAG: hypothetical protein ACREVE_09560 [Gammaproteobacteria bacterium]